jgi:hypothetical protein
MYERERERNIEWLVRKVEEILVYARTGSKQEGEWFETIKGVKQGCTLSPLLLLRKAQARGGVVVGRKKVWSLAKSQRERWKK